MLAVHREFPILHQFFAMDFNLGAQQLHFIRWDRPFKDLAVWDPHDDLVIKTYSGRVTARCVLSLLDRIEEDERYREGMAELDDMRLVSDLAITATEIGHFVDLLTGFSNRKRRPTRKAVLAATGPARIAAEAFCRETEFMESLKVGVFCEPEDAFQFLGTANDDLMQSLETFRLSIH